MTGIKCPKCGEQFEVDHLASVPDQQKMTISLRSESPFLAAEVIAAAIEFLGSGMRLLSFSKSIRPPARQAAPGLSLSGMS